MHRTLAVLALLAATADARAQIDFTLDRVVTNPRSCVPIPARAQWITGAEAFSVLTMNGDEQAVLRVPVDGTQPQQAFDSGDVHAAFGLDSISKTRLPTFGWHTSNSIRVEHENTVYHWNLSEAEPKRVLSLVDGATATAIAPSDARAAFVVHDDVHITNEDGGLRRITWDGAPEDIVYGGAAHRAEFGIQDGMWWDQTGRRLAFSREDMRPIAIFPYVEYGAQPAERKHGRYPMAGQPHSRVSIGIVDSRDGSLRYLEHDADADLYWTNVTFSPSGDRVYVALVNRGQDHMQLVEFDSTTGKRNRVLFTASDARWIEPEFGPVFLPNDPQKFLWFSPRDGYRNLYVYGIDGSLERQLTKAEFDLGSFGGFTRDKTACYATGTGPNPLEMHLWRIDLESGAMTQVSQGRGRHSCMISDHDHVLSNSQSAVDPGTLNLWTNDGKTRVLNKSKDPLADLDIGTQEFFEVAASDGTTLHGYLLKPPGFDPAKRYPLMHYVYGGPHSQLVTDTWGGGARLWQRWLASQGFLVSCVDNRGTNNRGIAFAQSIFRRLSVLEVQDQVAAIDALIERGFVDESRIGVHGWSYGGYMTIRLMQEAADKFACGVAGAPVTDWSRYETGYTERYMDTPEENPRGYELASCLDKVGKIRGRLLLITPSDDHTVMPSHSVAFLQKCIDESVLIDHMSYPMQQHGLRGKHRQHFYRLMTRFFQERLGGTPVSR